jgi:hypothetical protein
MVWIIGLLSVAGVLFSCIEPYDPPETNSHARILVVDAFLNGTENSCTVILSRTQGLTGTEAPEKENNAIIKLHDEAGASYTLNPSGEGRYYLTGIPTQTGMKYWISISTQDNETYESDKMVLQDVTEIDSVVWGTTEDGIQISVNTHGSAENSRYYRWDFDETWEYHAAFDSNIKYENGQVVLRDDNITWCWMTKPSTSIAVATSGKLSDNVIRSFPVAFIPKFSVKYQQAYSILVRQYALSEDEYEYWSLLKKNTENLGTLFDPQPSRLSGNIHHQSDPDKLVIGFFSASKVTQKRIFIRVWDLPSSFFFVPQTGCELDTLLVANLSNFSSAYLLTMPVYENGIFLIGYGYSAISCVDCRKQGGTNVKPDFWP